MKLRLFLLGVFLAGVVQPAAADLHFTFDCIEERFVSRPVGQQYQFRAPIRGLTGGSHPVQVSFETHYPDTWFAQWCQQSTGLCYYEDGQITLSGFSLDRLEIDFFPDPSVPAMGWVNVTIRSLEDPSEVARCTFTLYSGLPTSTADFHLDCLDNTRWLDESGYFEFYSPLVNRLPVADTLMVTIVETMPEFWNMHFCHDGICYYPYGEFRVLPNTPDSLTIMSTVGDGPANGGIAMVLQSKRNPSLAQYCGYWAYVRQPEAVEAAVPSGGGFQVLPNPSSMEATFLFGRRLRESGQLAIYRSDGRVVREYPSVEANSGAVGVRWDGRDEQGRAVPPGVYFYRWDSGGERTRGTLVRVR